MNARKYEGYVYLAQCNGCFKIGMSVEPLQRISSIQGSHANEVKIIRTLPTRNMIASERFLHDRFKNKRLSGEWFSLDRDDLEWFLGIVDIDAKRQGLSDEVTLTIGMQPSDIVSLFLAGYTIGDIIKRLYSATSGRAYVRYGEQIQIVIRNALEQALLANQEVDHP